ncbi:MAG: DUF4097 family beta strand repeat-containing protein [Eubacteriales bacterium]|nr:DUF4097 family beta strand repeat-containing protein [Eubacteriales bacterium]
MKNKKKWIGTAGVATIAGLLLMGAGYAMGGRPGFYVNQTGLHTANVKSSGKESYVLEKQEVEAFTELDIAADYANLSILPSDGYYLEYELDGNEPEPEYRVENGKLSFREGSVSRKGGFQFFTFGVGWDSSSEENFFVNVYVPEEVYLEAVKIQSESGNVAFEELACRKLEASLEYGNLTFDRFQGEELKLAVDSGNLTYEEIEADTVSVEMDYGNMTGETLKGDDLEVSLESGNFKAETVTDEKGESSLELACSYGNVTIGVLETAENVIEMESGELTVGEAEVRKMKVTDEYGSVKIGLRDGQEAYEFELEAEYGVIKTPAYSWSRDEGKVLINEGKEKKIQISCESGNITITDV